jgi:acetate---CoA ligase (ADP-forming)
MSAPATAAPEIVVLRDGAALELRRTCPADAAEVAAFHATLSQESLRLRFFGLGIDLHRTAELLVAPAVIGYVAVAGARTVGHGCLVPAGERSAELAFAVADDFHGRGVATLLLERLVAAAADRGFAVLTAEVDPSNHRMIDVFEHAGLPVTVRVAAGTLHVELPAALSPEAVARFGERHRRAAVAGLDHVLRPASVAVIGASRRRGTVGGELLHNILDGGYRGAVHVVHPHAERLGPLTPVRSVAQLPPGVDLAVVAVPSAAVLRVARACASAGVRSLVVLSAGFGEAGAAGRRRQEALARICRGAGMRLVGPNCLGVVATDPAVRLNATFAPQRVPEGRIALASQSGAVGLIAIDAAARRGLGLSGFVSLGNRADVSSNDLLRYWAEDPRTAVVALYLESFGNPRAFAEAARDVSAAKPVVALKAGRSPAGQRAAASHTGALVEGSEALADALFADAGVIRAGTVGELLDVAAVLARPARPRGRGVAILTNAGGAGIACADACEPAGLTVPALARGTQRRLHRIRPGAAVGNPVDLIADATAEHFAAALDALADDPAPGAVVALHVPPLSGRADDPLAAIARRAGDLPLPVVVVPLAQGRRADLAALVPVLATPEEAVCALGLAAADQARRERPADPPDRPPGIDRTAGAAVVAEALARGGGWLAPDLAERLALAYGLPLAASEIAGSATAVARAAAALGGAVAVKAIADGVVHKTERGAVRLGLASPAAARRAAAEMGRALRADGLQARGFLVQPMLPAGVELLVGAIAHPSFGPVVACGAGGTLAELLADVQVRLAPIGPGAAAEMVRALRCLPLLQGLRGAAPADLPAVEDAVRRVAALAADRPEVLEVECNPLIALPDGAVAVDLRVRLAAPGRDGG